MVYDDKRFYLCEHGQHLWRPAASDAGRIAGRRLGRLVSSCWPGDRDDVAWSIALTQRYVIAYPANNPSASERDRQTAGDRDARDRPAAGDR